MAKSYINNFLTKVRNQFYSHGKLCQLCNIPVEECDCINEGDNEIVIGENTYNFDTETCDITIIKGPLHNLYRDNVLSHNFDMITISIHIKPYIHAINMALTDPDRYLLEYGSSKIDDMDYNTKKIFCILHCWTQYTFSNESLYDIITGKHNIIVSQHSSYYNILMFINGIYHIIYIGYQVIFYCVACNELGIRDERYVNAIIELYKSGVDIKNIPQIILSRGKRV